MSFGLLLAGFRDGSCEDSRSENLDCQRFAEHIPVLAFGSGITPGSIGLRETFADIGQTIAAHLDLPAMDYGHSFI